MSLTIQAKLLRFLQEGEFYRIGGKRPIKVDVRVVSATNRDLEKEVREGRFREDLYYRLNTITLRMPPLRKRPEDIPALVEYFLHHSRFGGGSLQPLVRVHSECFTGDVLGSLRCDCGDQLALSKKLIAANGDGYIIYVRDHEGRGVGLAEKLKAYQLQDQGLDTVEANLKLGHPIDAREWSDVVEILHSLQLKNFTLLTNNPEKVAVLDAAGFAVTQQNLAAEIQPFNEKYIETKRAKLGHERENA
jgi:GTP cyclohydrolase II